MSIACRCRREGRDSIFKQPASAFSQRSAAPVVCKARGAPSFRRPRQSRGSGAPRGASIDFTPCGRLARPTTRGAHASYDASASRRSTGGICRRMLSCVSRHQPRAAFLEPAFAFRLRGPMQRAPRRVVLVPPERSPGAARVRGYEPRPQGPHPDPPYDVS